MSYKQINWIASYPKSGNTWVRLLLDAYLMGDIDLNEILCTVQDDPANVHQPSTGDNVVEMPVDIQQLTRPMAMLRFVLAYRQENSNIPLLVKTHAPHMLINGIELLPHSLTRSVVYLVRDPRDVVLSFSKHMGESIEQSIKSMSDKYRTLATTESRVADFIGSWAAHVRSFLNADSHNVRVFKYEDLRSDTEGTFSKILEHIGFHVDQSKVQKAIKITELSKLRTKEKESGFKESSPHAKNKFFGKGSVGGWREILNHSQIFSLEKEMGSVMKRIGYLDKRRVA